MCAFQDPVDVLPYLREAEFRRIRNRAERAAALVTSGFCSISVAVDAVEMSGSDVNRSSVSLIFKQ